MGYRERLDRWTDEEPDRTTADVIETLGADVDRCYKELIRSIDAAKEDESGCVEADGYHSRQLIRATLAWFEGVVFSVKFKCFEKCQKAGIETTDTEREMVIERSIQLNERGEVEERDAKLRFLSNVRFAIRLYERAEKITTPFDPGKHEWWAALVKITRARDRLTHPKLPGDLDVDEDEIVAALKARLGFTRLIVPEVFEGVDTERIL